METVNDAPPQPDPDADPDAEAQTVSRVPAEQETRGGFLPRLKAGPVGAAILLLIALPCFLALPWVLSAPSDDERGQRYNDERLGISQKYDENAQFQPPGTVYYLRQQQGEEVVEVESSAFEPLGTDRMGRSLLVRCLMGGAISLGVGISAALIAVFIGVTWGSVAGYIGGRTDAFMMRIVDIFYGLPYLLLVIMISVMVTGLVDRMDSYIASQQAKDPGYEPFFLMQLIQDYPLIINLLVLVAAIGGVSWLTMARVIRGQVLSLRTLPFIEAARAQGMGPVRIIRVHLLPNLMGPIIVYTTLAVPQAILQESFLSFLGIGVQEPLPSWGQLAAEGVKELPALALPELPFNWWLLVFPCVLLGLTLLSLNFMGDALREKFDPRSAKRNA